MYTIQKSTIATFLSAKKALNENIGLQTIAVVYDTGNAEFVWTDDRVALTRSVSDVVRLRQQRPLPLVSDILDLGVSEANGDYIIFTNTDIALTPWFYNALAAHIETGKYDALVINRRRIPARLLNAPIELQVAHAGKQHIGFDCFVFRKSLYTKFIRTNICLGIPMAGNDIFYNIFTFAENPVLLANQHMTYHIGMDLVKNWGDSDFYAHNKKEFHELLKQLKPSMQIAKFPGAGLPFFKRHFRWLMNPTYDYRTMCSVDFSQLGTPRPKPANQEMPGLAHRYYEWLQRKVNFREND